MKVRVGALGGLLLALALGGCFLPSQYDPFAPGVSVVIENRSGVSAEVFELRYGARNRMGTLSASGAEEFRLAWLEGGVRIEVRLSDGQRRRVRVQAQPGQTAHYLLETRGLTRMRQD